MLLIIILFYVLSWNYFCNKNYIPDIFHFCKTPDIIRARDPYTVLTWPRHLTREREVILLTEPCVPLPSPPLCWWVCIETCIKLSCIIFCVLRCFEGYLGLKMKYFRSWVSIWTYNFQKNGQEVLFSRKEVETDFASKSSY